jgi:hypothetical protein
MNIPYLEGTQNRIANFLTAQFGKPLPDAASSAPISAPAITEVAPRAIDGAPAPLLPAPAGAIPAPAGLISSPAIPSPADPIAVPGMVTLASLPVAAEHPLSGK